MTESVETAGNPADAAPLSPSSRDLFSKFDALIAQRQSLLDTGVKDPFGLVMEKVLSPTRAVINGKETILLGTYNYMGMTFDEDVIAAGKKALDEFGSGTTGSRVLNGTYQGHKECEEALKLFYGMDHAMVFSTGYQANLGVISTIAGKDDYVVLDIDSHASIYDGCAMGQAQIVPFRHNDISALENRLRRIPAEAGKLGVLEGVYSMLGDIAPLKEMSRCRRPLTRWCYRRGPRWASSAPRPRRAEEGLRRRYRLRCRHLLQVGRHGRRLLRFKPSQVRDIAPGLPALCLHGVLAAERGRDRRHLDPQADARRQEARPFVGKQQAPSRRSQGSGLPARHRNPAIGDHRGDHARSRTGRRDVGSAAFGRALRQPRPPAGNPRQHDPAALLALCRT